MNTQIQELILKHCITLKNECKALGVAVRRISGEGDFTFDDLEEALQLAHRIKGSSGTIGYADISVAAEKLEFFLRDVAANEINLDAVGQDKTQAFFTEMEALVDMMTPEQSTLYNRTFTAG